LEAKKDKLAHGLEVVVEDRSPDSKDSNFLHLDLRGGMIHLESDESNALVNEQGYIGSKYIA
jgi:hypothetical protein